MTPAHARRVLGAAALALSVPLLAGCRSVFVTPTALREHGGVETGREADREACLARWEEAVGLMNEFLASPWRRTLPPGRFELRWDGMRFTSDDACTWPIAVESSTWGDVVVATGFWAQEDEDGFVVGEAPPPAGAARDPLVDHTFFRLADRGWLRPASIAELTLHETTHVVWRQGTVGPWETIVYFAVAAGTFRSTTHPAESRPDATSEEFAWFMAHRKEPWSEETADRVLAAHRAAPGRRCEHGPFPAPCCPE